MAGIKYSTLFLILMLFSTCLPVQRPCMWEQYTIDEGTHPSRPYYPNISEIESLNYEFQFHESCRYDFGTADQRDWNKLGGVALNVFDSHDNTAMWSFRYNPEKDVLEFGFYYHVDKKVVKAKNPEPIEGFDDEVWVICPIGGTVTARLVLWRELERVTMEIETGGRYAHNVMLFPEVPRVVREVNTWFGGNNSAPHTMHFYKTTECF